MKARRPQAPQAAFTLLELLVATAVFLLIIGVVVQFVNQTSQIWRDSNSRIQAFQEARAGYESMTRTLSQATLNTYFDYYDDNYRPRARLTSISDLRNFVPATYDRLSDLHFISGDAASLLQASPKTIKTQTHAIFFQAPRSYSVSYQNLDGALNAIGYFLRFDDGADAVPDFIENAPSYRPRYRFRLMEMVQETEKLGIYFDPGKGAPPGDSDWFTRHAESSSRVIAENVIALVLLPRLSERQDDPGRAGQGVSLAPNYAYNSRIALKASSDENWPGANPPFPPDAFTAYPADGGTTPASRHHQLPPLVRVLMVVIDEPSAIRLQGTSTTIPGAIDFSRTELFKDARNLAADIQSVEDVCQAKSGNPTGNVIPLNYRVFTSDIILHQAKWSNN